MMAFPITSSVTEAINILNRSSADDVRSILKRLMSSKTKPLSNADEIDRLSKLLFKTPRDASSASSNPQRDAVKLMEICQFILHRARYHQLHGAALASFLQDDAGMKPEFAELFALACNSESIARALDQSHEELIFGTPRVLESVDWKLHMRVASAQSAESRDVRTTISFGFGRECDEEEVEFSQDELFGLFEKLERIQEQLDSL